ncbi:SPOR domain-containing protein [Alkalimarinus coralli]|uniref:SPOR domain-containing protein n=1 Tax=Alkalimarinus coralli TaxID=2935863 RepID=UPI00202AD6DB|nr:SPOR domain-containing protein [Alkalimarinus coralli]
MRWIFLTLLLLNALFALLEWSASLGGRETDGEGYRAAAGIQVLALLGESAGGGSIGKRLAGDANDQLCLLIGPLADRGKAKFALESMQRTGIKAEMITQTTVRAPNYWVYLQPYESRKAAISKLRELQESKVDSYLITQGELANGISLGVFENIDSARRMLERRQGQGYSPKVKELGKKGFEYWLATEDAYTPELDQKIAKTLEELKMSPGKRQIFCKSVASEKKLP